jgi:beta-lactamase regulating signal transducer with metallopeptidase domain
MTHISAWISPQLAHTLAWALIHFLWQGLALAAICSALMAMCRTASARYVIGLVTLALMLAAPVTTFFSLQRSATVTLTSIDFMGLVRQGPVLAVSKTAENPLALTREAKALDALALYNAASNHPIRPDALLLLVEAWFAGIVFLSLRTAGGFVVIERIRRKATRPVGALLLEKCLALQRRMGLTRAIHYCECLCVQAPAVIGWFRPIVLLPVTALSGLSEDQLAAVICHELAHIRRLDSFVNVFQIAAETVLFYHPAVWWLNKRIRTERENCCDDVALSVCGNPVEYARALTLMEELRQQPVMAMAANRSPLVARVARLLGVASPRSGVRSAGIAASILCLAGALLAANGLMAAGHSSRTVTGSLSPSTYESASAVSSRFAASSAKRLTNSLASNLVRSVARTLVARTNPTGYGQGPYGRSPYGGSATQSAQTQEGQGQGTGQGEGQGQSSSSSSSYVDQMKAQGYDNLTADELISLKVQGVTPEYIQQIKALGLHPSVNELISMRVQGIDPQYIKDMRDAGFSADIHQLISLRVQGVTPEYVRGMRSAGIDGDVNDFISMRVQGLTPEYVEEMKAAGVDAKAQQLIAMKVQGVTPEYVSQMKAAGFNTDVNQLIAMRVQGMSADYVRDMRAAGINGTAVEFISMKVQGITPEYVRDMRSVGVDGDSNKFISFKVQGVTPDYVKEMKAAGFDSRPNQLIAMKVQGITPDYIEEMKATGIDMDMNRLIGMKVQGVTPDYIKDMKAAGVSADANQLIGMRVQGLTPEYVKEMKAAGVNASTNQLIGMRVQGVTPEYVKSLQSAGLQNLDADDCIRARVAGITPEFIANVRSHGFKDLSIDKLIDLKNAGVF